MDFSPVNGGAYHQLFPFNDDEVSEGYPRAADANYGNFMTALAGHLGDNPLRGYAQQWLTTTGARPENFAAAVATAAAARPFDALPTDYYAPGAGFLYGRGGWSAGSMAVNFQLGVPTAVGHAHKDVGTFQLMRGGRWCSPKAVST